MAILKRNFILGASFSPLACVEIASLCLLQPNLTLWLKTGCMCYSGPNVSIMSLMSRKRHQRHSRKGAQSVNPLGVSAEILSHPGHAGPVFSNFHL